jgi:hypothetical protein
MYVAVNATSFSACKTGGGRNEREHLPQSGSAGAPDEDIVGINVLADRSMGSESVAAGEGQCRIDLANNVLHAGPNEHGAVDRGLPIPKNLDVAVRSIGCFPNDSANLDVPIAE